MTKTQLEETDRVRAIFDEFGPQKRPRHGLGGPDPFSDGREWLTAQASGEVLEVGVGTGRNLRERPIEWVREVAEVSGQRAFSW
jgi:hypothetical protein